MSVADQIMGGATKIQKDGWVTGEMGSVDGAACLLGSVQGTYEVTPAVEAIFRCIIEECDRCRKEFQIWAGINELIDPVGIVWRHNDDCLQSPEDAILLLKKAAHAVSEGNRPGSYFNEGFDVMMTEVDICNWMGEGGCDYHPRIRELDMELDCE